MACQRESGGPSDVVEAGGMRTGEVGEGIENNENCIVRRLSALCCRSLAHSNSSRPKRCAVRVQRRCCFGLFQQIPQRPEGKIQVFRLQPKLFS